MNTYHPVNRRLNRCLKTLIFFMTCIAAACSIVPCCQATELEVTLVSGSVFLADVPIDAINWKEVQSDGQITNRRVATEEINRLWLCETPASNQIAEINQLLVRLQSDEFRTREDAERQLSASEIGGSFPKMLLQLKAGADAETKYRINRIMDKISDSDASAASEFDELELKSGRILRGDAGSFSFICNVDGHRLKLERNQLLMLRQADKTPPPESAQKREAIKAEIVLESKDKFYLPQQTTISLETDPLGNELTRKTDISRVFTPLGLQLSGKEPGYVGISGYGFKYPGTPTGKNSGCVFTLIKNADHVRPKKFRGTLIIEFCVPNQPLVPAGVNEFGIHIATVNRERDFIMEAFNSVGQIIASVEAGERDCPFLGVRSNEPIARLRIRSNPFLHKLNRKIDVDYAFDSICFSKPQKLSSVAVVNKSTDQKSIVRLKNKNTWAGDRMEIKPDGSIDLFVEDFEKPLTLPADVIESYSSPEAKTIRRPNRRSWSMQLTDGSILHVDPQGSQFRSQLVSEYIVPTDRAVALWPTESPARLAPAADWSEAKNVITLPTGRILTDGIEFTAKGYNWQTLDRRIQDLAPNAHELAGDEDPMPDLQQVIYKEVDDQTAPTLWLKQPETLDPSAGAIVLRDGQRLALGEGNLFQLIERGKDSIKLKLNEHSIEINNDRVLSVKMEQKP